MADTEAIREALARVLASPQFARAERLSRFLRSIVERVLAGEGERSKEYVLGLEIFDRPSSFDPKSDPIVRTTARQVRFKLAEYYAGPGQADRLVIDLPKGAYVPVFRAIDVVPPQAPAPRARPRWVARAAALLIAALTPLGWIAARSMPRWGADAPARPRSIVVLPFANLTGDPERRYITDGLTDDLTAILAAAPTLRVVARSSANAFRDRGEDVRRIGQVLQVDAVVEGSVRLVDQRWRVTLLVSRTSDGYTLWSESFGATSSELPALPQTIGRRLAPVLLADPEAAASIPALMARRTADADAYAEYLQGRYFWNKRDVASMRKALDHFDRALARDPDFALAHAAVAQTWAVLEVNAHVPPKQGTVRAKAAAHRALELDPSVAEAWAALGLVVGLSDHAWGEAESMLQKAIAANPNAATTYGWYGNVLMAQARLDEAAAMLERAEQLDPLSISIKMVRGEVANYARRPDQVMARARAIAELDPQRDEGPYLRALAHLLRNELDLCAQAAQQIRDPVFRRYWEVGLAGLRKEPEFRTMAERLGRDPAVNGYAMASIFARTGDRERAFAWLDRSYAAGESALIAVRVDPAFDGLRTDPRYAALVAKLD